MKLRLSQYYKCNDKFDNTYIIVRENGVVITNLDFATTEEMKYIIEYERLKQENEELKTKWDSYKNISYRLEQLRYADHEK